MRADPEDRFDALEGSEGARSRRGILRILVAGLAVAAFGAAVWYAYTLGARSGSPSDVPLVTADQAPWKKRPEDPGGLEVPNQDKSVFDRLEPELAVRKEERLLPPPEEPMERPALPEVEMQADATAPLPTGSEASGAPETPPAEEEVTAVERSPESADPRPQETLSRVETPTQTEAPSQTEPPARGETRTEAEDALSPPTASKPGSGEAFRIQLASLRSEADARRTWERIRSGNQDLLGELGMKVERANLGAGKGVFYRLQAGPLEDKALADLLCGKLKSRKLACLVVAR